MRLGLNDVGLVVVIICMYLYHYSFNHSIVPKLLVLEPSNIGILDGDWLSHKFID